MYSAAVACIMVIFCSVLLYLRKDYTIPDANGADSVVFSSLVFDSVARFSL